MMRRRFAVAALAGSLLALATTGNAQAYCRTNSCDTGRGEKCSADMNGCLTGGLPLAWASSCVTFTVQQSGSPLNQIDAQQFQSVIEKSFQTWMNADCGEGSHPSISVSSIGEVECNKVEYNKDQGNSNIYLFRDEEWEAVGAANALALTTVWYDWKTGEIYDADVEVNGTAGDVTNTEPGAGANLLSIITHESGHFLGLGHSPFDTAATMYTVYEPTRGNLRHLSQDDVDGICAVYPPDREATTSECNPRHGFSTSCSKDKSGCAATPGRGSDNAGWLLLGVALAGALSRRRRRGTLGSSPKESLRP